MIDAAKRAKFLKAVKSERSGNIVLPAGRLMYASLFTATKPSKTETDPKKFQYSTTVLLPADVDLSVLEAEVKSLFEENVPANKRAGFKWKNPILKTAEEGTLAAYADDFPHCLRMNSKQFDRSGKERPRPSTVYPDGKDVPEGEEVKEVYNGRWARVSINPFWYSNEQSGVSLGLQNVQLMWNDDPLAGGKVAASADFEAIDEGDLADFESEEFK